MLAIAWMLTYLLHSTLLLGLAWAVSKPLSRWSVAAEETVWKLALVGALCTASLQLAAGWQPLAGRWNLAAPAQVASSLEATQGPVIPATTSVETVRVPVRAIRVTAPAAVPPAALPRVAASTLILGVWALGALVLLAASGRSVFRLGRRLRSRPRVVGGTLHGQLRGLAAEAGLEGAVRLSCSSRVPVPVALGVLRPEICVPPRALASLSDEQQEGMLAHELAHLARRDPFWLLLGQGIACVLFFQPLNWVARRRLREIAEMLSDEWAVARTGRPLSLAACLAEVAGWSVGMPALPVPGMADQPSSLGRRIRRLLDESRSPEAPGRRAWLAAAMGLLVIAVAAAAPAISAARPEPPPAPAAKAAPAPARIDVNDATDAPTARAVAEVDRHGDAATANKSQESENDDAEPADPAVDADDIADPVSDSVQAALDGMDGELQSLSRQHEMTAEQQEKLSRDMGRMSKDLQQRLNPRLEKLTRELAEKASRMAPSPEMQRLTQEMAKLGAQMRPNEEELAKMRSMVDEQVRKHASEGKLTAEERERIQRQAREMAESMKPTAEQRRQLEELRAQLETERAKMGDQFRAANRDEVEKLQREVREEVEREMQGMREEMRRTFDERKAIERQDRHDRKTLKHRHDAKPDSDDDHDKDGAAPKPPAKPAAAC
ncbi:MAG TPA: M56 family metallopeptidase [Thermoanaerobaculia bacterium]|jgi:beta-lactamase regulating signal transducer with metallopeptidase domain